MTQREEKTRLRRLVLAKRRALSNTERLEKSQAIARRLVFLEEYQRAQWLHLYLSFRDEVITEGLVEETLAQGKQVVVPVVRKGPESIILSELKNYPEEIGPGAYGIPEPREQSIREVDPAQVDLFVLPGVAFDLRGRRLGYGAGFYDRILAPRKQDQMPRTGAVPVIALAFECQVVERMVAFSHDIPVHKIVTENRVIVCPETGQGQER